MQPLQPLLERIGFNHQESGVYLYLLVHGEAPASKVASATHIPRSTVRGILDKLCVSGIVTKVYKRNTQYYSCRPPSTLVHYLERQVETTQDNIASMRKALPLFAAVHSHPGVVPKVQVFEGPDQVIEAFNHSLFVDGIDEILFMTSYHFLRDPVVKKNDINFYIPRRIKKGIRMKVLVGRAEDKDIPYVNDTAQLRERRQLTTTRELPGNFHVYGNFVVYFSAGANEYLAVLVESPMMAETMRSMFNVMWDYSKKEKSPLLAGLRGL